MGWVIAPAMPATMARPAAVAAQGTGTLAVIETRRWQA
jgi:hypothetical protein